jgi:hypothetical protein
VSVVEVTWAVIDVLSGPAKVTVFPNVDARKPVPAIVTVPPGRVAAGETPVTLIIWSSGQTTP